MIHHACVKHTFFFLTIGISKPKPNIAISSWKKMYTFSQLYSFTQERKMHISNLIVKCFFVYFPEAEEMRTSKQQVSGPAFPHYPKPIFV